MMKALAFNKTGKAEEVLELIEKEIPVPGDDEVLVRVLASPINPSDLFFIRGTYRFKPEFPDQGAGFEGAGIIEGVGRNVGAVGEGPATDAGIQKGALVAFFYKRAWAEYVVVPVSELSLLPDGFPVEKAAQFTLNPFTAWGLLEALQPVAGEWLLLTGANSSVSRLVIQLAKQKGVKIIALIRNITQAAGLRELGADEVLNIGDEQLATQLQQITGGKGFTMALDAVGGAIGTKIFENIAPFGRFVVYGAMKNEASQYFNGQIVYKNLTIKGFGIRAYLTQQDKAGRAVMISSLIKELGKSSFKMPVAQTYTWDRFKEALGENAKTPEGKILFGGLSE